MLFIEIENLKNLTNALEHFVGQETVEKYMCRNCSKYVTLDKRMTINQLSPILIINFKRCAYTFDSTEKLTHQVNYNELLNVAPYMTSLSTSTDNTESTKVSKDIIYKLYAVINHAGNDLHSGHYYSYVRTSNNVWYLANDTCCRRVTLDEVLNHPEALMLFYAKSSYTPTLPDTSVGQITQQLRSSIVLNNSSFNSTNLSFSV